MPNPTLGELFTQVMQQIPSSQEVNAKYTKPAGGIPETDLASGVIPDTSGFLTQHQDISGKADKTDTVLNSSLSIGRKNNTTVGNKSVAIGYDTTAVGAYSFAIGYDTLATSEASHAEGGGTTASGQFSHAEGGGTTASGTGSHAEGASTIASGFNAHAEGSTTTASGQYSHAEGTGTKATNGESHAEGAYTTASGSSAHSEGTNTVAAGSQCHAEGLGGTYTDNGTTKYYGAYGTADHVEGFHTLTANGMPGNHAEGYETKATGGGAHSEGNGTTASGLASHAEGTTTIASGMSSHAEGMLTTASGMSSHAEGNGTSATSLQAHAEGSSTTASGNNAHAEGNTTIASGLASHAEGVWTIALAEGQHAGGQFNIADSYASWVEWVASTSYTVGDKVKVTTTVDNETTVKGYICKTANSDAEFTAANWTLDDEYNYVEIIGNGTANNARSNARALDWDGNEYLMGDVYVGCNADSTGGTKLAKITDIPAAVDTSTLAPKANPVFTGSISMGRSSTGNTGTGSVALGNDTKASGMYSFAIGSGTDASGFAQFVCGKYNKYEGNGKWLFIVGNGTGSTSNNVSNAFTVHNNGNGYFKGDVYANCAADTSNGSKLATESFVTTRVPAPPVADGTYNLQVSVSSGVATYSWVSTGA